MRTPRKDNARGQAGEVGRAAEWDRAFILAPTSAEIKTRRQQRGHTAIAGALFVVAVGLVLAVRGWLS